LRGSDWRASLENPETGQRIGFSGLEQLFVYLMDRCEGTNEAQDTEFERRGRTLSMPAVCCDQR